MLKISSLKILKNAKIASNFYFPCLERLGNFFNISIYGLLLVNWHISGTVLYNMVILLNIGKVALEKSENLEKEIL